MYEKELSEISKEKLVELCDGLLSELWNNGTFSNHYILTMLSELSNEN